MAVTSTYYAGITTINILNFAFECCPIWPSQLKYNKNGITSGSTLWMRDG